LDELELRIEVEDVDTYHNDDETSFLNEPENFGKFGLEELVFYAGVQTKGE
jgi:hypothetical protein